jgi:hypothetical protein
VFFQAVDRGDVRVVQRYEHFRFAPETRKPVKVRTRMAKRLSGQPGEYLLHEDRAVLAPVRREVLLIA